MATPRHIPNAIGHFDIAGPDLESLGRFYAGLLGWNIAPQGPGYASIETPAGAVNGALVETASGEASITIGIVVPDLASALAKAAQSGGKIVMPLTDNGWVRKGQISDPAGNRITLIQG